MTEIIPSAPGPIDALKPLILGTGVDPTCLTGVSALRSIIPQCWDIDPTQRPAASRILECISIPPKTEVRLAASEDQGGIPSPHPGDHSGHGGVASQEQTYVAPGRAGALCMNCQQYPKVPGQDCCSKACLDNGSSRLSASAENDALNQRVAVSNFSNLSSPVTAKHNTPHSMRAGFYLSTAESTRLSKERQPMSQGNGVSFKDQEDNPQAVAETTFKLHQQTASAPGKAADKDTATNPTTSGNSYLGEGLQNIFHIVFYGIFTTDCPPSSARAPSLDLNLNAQSQAKRSDANQATPSRRKPKQNEDSGTRYTGLIVITVS
ncbi:hypothetical protein FRC00_002244 [Tulasnella sp. 408]|nr:hypothetical protein FRC00_002244 [Tulasnella sp. 408]